MHENIWVQLAGCRLADKPWQKVLLADLLWEKNTAEWLADSVDKLKRIRSSRTEILLHLSHSIKKIIMTLS